MTKRTTYILGNWKMNLNVGEASLLLHTLDELVKVRRDLEVVLLPPMLSLQTLNLQVNHRKFKLGAQNLYWRDHGAFTGEVSANQLRGLVKYALVGHSERRHVFNETYRDTGKKVQAAIRNHIKPVLCIGETLGERADGETGDVLRDQLVAGLANVTSEDINEVVIAYEPVWAIGTGENAKPDDVDLAVRAIRAQIKHLFGPGAAKAVPVLYGGSVNSDNASAYLAVNGIDGLLVGGASLTAKPFAEIINKAHSASQ